MSRLIRANYSKGWDAKLLAYVPGAWDTVAELPGAPCTTSGQCRAHGHMKGTAVDSTRVAIEEECMTIHEFFDALKDTRAAGYQP